MLWGWICCYVVSQCFSSLLHNLATPPLPLPLLKRTLLSPTLSPILSPPPSLREGLLLCRKSLGLYRNTSSGEVKGKVKDHHLSIHWFIHFPNTYFVLSVLDLWHFKQRIKQVLNAPLMNTTAFPFTEVKEKRTRQKWAGIKRKNGQRNMSRKYKSWMPKDKRDERLTSTYSFSWYRITSISPSSHPQDTFDLFLASSHTLFG